MECKEIREIISCFIDNELDEKYRSEVQNHINSCSSCYFDYHIVTLAKKIVSSKYKKVNCPEKVRERIIYNLAKQKRKKFNLTEYLKALLSKKSFRFSFALTSLIILTLLIFNPFEKTEKEHYKKLAAEIYENCKNIRSHKFPEKTIFTSNTEAVIQFISTNGIKNPILPKTDWEIAVTGIEFYKNCVLAHLLFKCESDTVYMFECEIDKLKNSKYLVHFQKIQDHLRTQKYVDVNHNGCRIIFRLEGNILLAFAMNYTDHHSFEELIASLE